MNFRVLNEYLEKGFEHRNIKTMVSGIECSTFLDDEVIKEGMWFLDISDVYRAVCNKYPYLGKVDSIINRMMKRKRIDLVPFEYKGECRDAHFPLKGGLYNRGFVECKFGYTETVKDVPVYGHAMGHLMEHVLLYKKERVTQAYDDELILQNVLPIVMERLMMEEFGNKGLENYYKKFRVARLKKMCMVDDMLRSSECCISHETLVDSLDYDVAITYADVEDYTAEIELGNDPVYKAYCYYMADKLACKMLERRNFKKDIQSLLVAKSVVDFENVLGQEVKR